MTVVLFSVLAPFCVLLSVIFLIYRFRFFSDDDISGRYPFLFGGILLFFVSIWQVVKNITAYNEWFIESAYPILDLSQLAFFIGGIFLMVIGLAFYADFWQTKQEEIITRDQQLSIINNLQHDAREPYQLVELLNISLKEIVSQLPETSGAIFLLNRNLRQLVLTTEVGLTRQETAYLEHYPLGKNIITQAIELGEPIISGLFNFIDSSGKISESRFNSCLMLPLISGFEKIGGLILFSERTQFFKHAEIRYLSPVAGWLAEKIKSARLTRELAVIKKESEKQNFLQTEFNKRFLIISASFSRSDLLTSFCRSLTGLINSESVYLLGLKNGTLYFYGESEPLLDLSENYKTALIDSLDRDKPLIINQEAVNKDERSYVTRSTLIFPFKDETNQNALMFVKESTPFRVEDDDLKVIDIYAHLAHLALKQSDTQRLDITRRKGLDKVLALLRFDNKIRFEEDTGFFVKHLSSILPPGSMAITFVKQSNSSFKATDGLRISSDELNRLELLPGEGIVGNVSAGSAAQFVSGKNRIAEAIQTFDESNQNIISGLFGERGLPGFLAACPISGVEGITMVAVIFMFDVSEKEKGEWQKLLTLATGLYSLRFSINKLLENQRAVKIKSTDAEILGKTMNKLNNHFSAIIGNAELVTMRTDLSGEIKNHFQSIINEAESAAGFLKDSLGSYSSVLNKEEKNEVETKYINDVIESVLAKSRISANLFMVGGRPREINRTLGHIEHIEFTDESVRNLFEEAINRFASLAEDEDVISISTYTRDGYVYLDISRHHRNFPPVQKVSEFGEYQISHEVLKYRPIDTFLKYVSDNPSFYSYDRLASDPSYLSFKFPVKKIPPETSLRKTKLKILAIDDQAVILDLISAMCQTSGYEVITANTGVKGLELALNEEYNIILTDLAMPGLSGLEIAREIKKKKPETPIVLITGWEVNLDKLQLDAAGITKVLYKPFRIEQLVDIINTLAASRIPS